MQRKTKQSKTRDLTIKTLTMHCRYSKNLTNYKKVVDFIGYSMSIECNSFPAGSRKIVTFCTSLKFGRQERET